MLELMRERIAKLAKAQADDEFERLRQGVLPSVDSRLEIEGVLDDSSEFMGVTATPLYEIYRLECVRAGSLDSDAVHVARGVSDALNRAREAAWGIRAPAETADRRENEKLAGEADGILREAIAKVEHCASGSSSSRVDPRPRVRFDDQSLRVTIGADSYVVPDPLGYQAFKAIYEASPDPITSRIIGTRTRQRGQKKWCRYLGKLPPELQRMIHSGTRGYWFVMS